MKTIHGFEQAANIKELLDDFQRTSAKITIPVFFVKWYSQRIGTECGKFVSKDIFLRGNSYQKRTALLF